MSYVLGTAKLAALEREIISRDEILKEVWDCIAKAQAPMKKKYDAKHKEREFEVGDFVYLKLQRYRQMSLARRKDYKLSVRFYGPFEILEKYLIRFGTFSSFSSLE